MDSIITWVLLAFFAISAILKLITALPDKKQTVNYCVASTTADFIIKNNKNKWRY